LPGPAPLEFRFSLADQWSRHLFVALMRRYGIQPYRYSRQRRTTVMARLSRSFLNDTLWPEFLKLQAGEAEERGEEGTAAESPGRRLEPVDHQPSLL
jgi:hypothetical protein